MHHIISYKCFFFYNELVIILSWPCFGVSPSSLSCEASRCFSLRFPKIEPQVTTIFSLITKYTISTTDTRLKPMHRPRSPPTLATNEVTVTFSSLTIFTANESFLFCRNIEDYQFWWSKRTTRMISKYVWMKIKICIKRTIGLLNTLTILMSLAIIYRFTIWDCMPGIWAAKCYETLETFKTTFMLIENVNKISDWRRILRYFSKNVVLTNLDINVQPQKISFCVFIQRVHRHLTTFVKMKSTPHLWTRFELWWNGSRHISSYFMQWLDLISSFISTTWCKSFYKR